MMNPWISFKTLPKHSPTHCMVTRHYSPTYRRVTNSPDVVTAGWLDSPPTPGPTLHSAPWTPATSKPKDTGVNKLEIDIGRARAIKVKIRLLVLKKSCLLEFLKIYYIIYNDIYLTLFET